jgi:hypothetical protein
MELDLYVGEALFRPGDLDDYLRAPVRAIDGHVRQHVTAADMKLTDAEIAKRLLSDTKLTLS